MSNEQTPEGWTDEQWQDYLANTHDASDDGVELVTMDVVDVPEIESAGEGNVS